MTGLEEAFFFAGWWANGFVCGADLLGAVGDLLGGVVDLLGGGGGGDILGGVGDLLGGGGVA